MITRCDHCGSKFDVSTELVNSEDPQVRCGECMTLFNARRNLYNEAEFQRASTRYQPVRRMQPGEILNEQVSDQPVAAEQNLHSREAEYDLETADTVASEHFYTRSTTVDRPRGGGITDSGVSGIDTSAAESSVPAPDINLDNKSTDYKPYRVSNAAAADVEFERTMASESALDKAYQGSASKERVEEHRLFDQQSASSDHAHGSYRRETYTPSPRVNESYDEQRYKNDGAVELPAEDVTELRRQQSAERERRALTVEPTQRLDDQHLRQLEEIKARSNDRLKIDPIDLEIQNDLDIELDTKTQQPSVRSPAPDTSDRKTGRDDYAFIPDDVLQKPNTYRDNWRRDENMHFDSETPSFETSIEQRQSAQSRNPGSSLQAQVSPTDLPPPIPTDNSQLHEPHKTLTESVTATPALEHTVQHETDPVKSMQAPAVDQHEQLETSTKRLVDGKDDERYTANPSSAQEMRRYQQHRPEVEVSDYVESEPVKNRQFVRTATNELKPALWTLGIIAAICLVLFAARNLIGNMNLPEPLTSAFCSVTGCVPDQPKKDVSQLEASNSSLSYQEADSTLVISVDVVNNSVYKQPYPTLAINLLDSEGASVGARNFSRVNYEVVDQGESEFLIPGEPTKIKIELVDSGLGATDMEVEFN